MAAWKKTLVCPRCLARRTVEIAPNATLYCSNCGAVMVEEKV